MWTYVLVFSGGVLLGALCAAFVAGQEVSALEYYNNKLRQQIRDMEQQERANAKA